MLSDWLEYAKKQNLLPSHKDSKAYTDEELKKLKEWIIKSYHHSKIPLFGEEGDSSPIENIHEIALEAERYVESNYVRGEFIPDTTYINDKHKNGLPSIDKMRSKFEQKFGESIDLKTPFPLLNDYLEIIKTRYGIVSARQIKDATLEFAALMNWLKEYNEEPLVVKRRELKGVSALLLGSVQVGKSTRINALLQIAPAFYDVVVILTSNNNRLQQQGQKRIEEDITGYNSLKPSELYDIFRISKKRIEQGEDKLPRDVIQLITKRANKNNKGDNLSSLGITPDTSRKKTYVLVIKKEKSILNKLYNWLKDQFGEDILGKLSLLIIDDESDYASPHNVKSKEIDEARVISKEIRKTMEKLPKNLYIGVTATPWGVFFGSRPTDKESSYPSFIQIISPPVGYLSPYHFFSITCPGEYKVNEMEDKKYPFVVNTDHPAYPQTKYLEMLISEKVGEFDVALINSLNYYLLTGAIMNLRGLQNDSHVMMIHTDTSIKEHKNLKALVDRYFDKVLQPILTDADTIKNYPEFWDHIKELYIKLYEKDKDQIITLYKDELKKGLSPKSKVNREIGQLTAPINEDLIPESICTFFKELRHLDKKINKAPRPGVHIMNSDKAFSKFELTKGNKAIIIGGFAIGRGLTLDGLRVSYYDRKINIAEAGIQHLRFSGYHSNRDLIRVFLNTERIREFEEITSDLFILEMKLRDCDCTAIVDYKLNLPKNGDIALTSKTVNMKINQTKPFNESREAAAFDVNKEILTNQNLAVEQLIDNLLELENYGEIERYPFESKNIAYRDVPISLLANFLTQYPCSSVGGRFTEFDKTHFTENIQTLLKEEVKSFDVSFINVHRPYKGINPKNKKFGKFDKNFGLANQTLHMTEFEDVKTGKMSAFYGPQLGRVLSQGDRRVGLTDVEMYFAMKLYIWYTEQAFNETQVFFHNLSDKAKEIKEEFYNIADETEKYNAIQQTTNLYNIKKKLVKEQKDKEKQESGNNKNKLLLTEISDTMYRLSRPTARLIIKGFNPGECQIGDTFPDIDALFGFYIFPPVVKKLPEAKTEITQKIPS